MTTLDTKQNSKQNQPAPFLTKTYNIISEEDTNDIIFWGDSGDTFVVADVTRLSAEVLPTVFKHSNYSSFIRQLNIYGFKKVSTQKHEFQHKYFKRGQPELLMQIKRTNQSSNQTNEQLQMDNINLKQQLAMTCAVLNIALMKLQQLNHPMENLSQEEVQQVQKAVQDNQSSTPGISGNWPGILNSQSAKDMVQSAQDQANGVNIPSLANCHPSSQPLAHQMHPNGLSHNNDGTESPISPEKDDTILKEEADAGQLGLNLNQKYSSMETPDHTPTSTSPAATSGARPMDVDPPHIPGQDQDETLGNGQLGGLVGNFGLDGMVTPDMNGLPTNPILQDPTLPQEVQLQLYMQQLMVQNAVLVHQGGLGLVAPQLAALQSPALQLLLGSQQAAAQALQAQGAAAALGQGSTQQMGGEQMAAAAAAAAPASQGIPPGLVTPGLVPGLLPGLAGMAGMVGPSVGALPNGASQAATVGADQSAAVAVQNAALGLAHGHLGLPLMMGSFPGAQATDQSAFQQQQRNPMVFGGLQLPGMQQTAQQYLSASEPAFQGQQPPQQ